MRNIRQLDSLRGIAVILVILSHWLPETNIVNRLPLGGIGVDIFFVLSGFLISRILFIARNSGAAKDSVIRNFYVRRALRIFPIYYITIFLMYAFHEYTESHIKENFVYFLTYTSNFYFFDTGGWDGMVSHLWSLAVEEQFYLLWPFVVLFTPKKYLQTVIVIFIVVGVASQLAWRTNEMLDVLTWCCFDSFGMGALLAWVWTYRENDLTRYYRYISVAAVGALIVFCAGVPNVSWDYVPFRTLVSVMSLWAIAYVITNVGKNRLALGFAFNNRPLIFIGKISYGLYLFHLSVPTITEFLLKPVLSPLLRAHIPLTPFYFGVNSVILLTIAVFSYYVIEKRFLDLKKYFNYDKRSRVPVIAEPSAAELVVVTKEKAGT